MSRIDAAPLKARFTRVDDVQTPQPSKAGDLLSAVARASTRDTLATPGIGGTTRLINLERRARFGRVGFGGR